MGSFSKTVAVPARRCVRLGKYVFALSLVVILARHALSPDEKEESNGGGRKLAVSGRPAGSRPSRALAGAEGSPRVLGAEASIAESIDNTSSSSASANALHECGHHQEYEHPLNATLSFLFLCCLICTILDHGNLVLENYVHFPISVIMFTVGGCLGLTFINGFTYFGVDYNRAGFSDVILGIQSVSMVDPHALLYIILPPLLYESSSAISWHVLRKILPSAVVLAVPGVILNTFLTGFFVRVLVHVDGEPPAMKECWLLSSILSATDPVAVVAALASLGAPPKLAALVEGESLMNDGSAVVLFMILRDWTADIPEDEKQCPGNPFATGCFFVRFLYVAVGGCIIGAVAGEIVYRWIGWARRLHYSEIELSILLVAVYGVFFLAEAVKTSGVLAVVTLGMMMGANIKTRLSHDARHNHHVVFQQIGYACNQVTFLVAGIISARLMWVGRACNHSAFRATAWLELVGLYVFIHVTRAMVIFTFSPMLTRTGYGLTRKECAILVYGGLRGAVGLIMGLIVEHQDNISAGVRQMIAFHTSGIVFLTLLINGSTVTNLYKWLDIYPLNAFSQHHMTKILAKLEVECAKGDLKVVSRDWFFRGCDFANITACVPNFQKVKFDEKGVPEPEGLKDVKSTLRVLSGAANLLDMKRTSSIIAGELKEGGFTDYWKEKRNDTTAHFRALIENVNELHSRKDHLFKVIPGSDAFLITYDGAASMEPGAYVSSRPLSGPQGVLPKHKDEDVGFLEIQLKKIEGVKVVIGLIMSNHPTLIPAVEPTENQVLGIADNSVGFDCHTCQLFLNGPFGSDRISSKVDGPLCEGTIIAVSVHREPGSEWEVNFTSKMDREVHHLCGCVFGPFTPCELYPVVEFHPLDTGHTTRGSYPRQSVQQLAAPICAAAGMVRRMSFRGSANSEHATVIHSAFAEADHDELHPPDSPRTAPGSLHCPAEMEATFVSTKSGRFKSLVASSKSELIKAKATVDLGFEPQVATDSESINEVFEVFFNTLRQKYIDFHEHGIIGDVPLAWLIESVAEGADCANHEVCARHGSINRKSEKAMMRRSASQASLAATDKRQRAIAKMMNGILGNFRNDEKKQKVVMLFEPLFVEYECLELVVRRESMWARLPSMLTWFRKFEFNFTRAKIESLWAFIEAHERMLAESPTLQRFPDLLGCINHVVEEARSDLQLLADLRPRSFFFTKHLIMLRFLLNGRLAELSRYVKEGWLTDGNAAVLKEAIFERIAQADTFFPQIQHGRRGGNRLSGARHSGSADVQVNYIGVPPRDSVRQSRGLQSMGLQPMGGMRLSGCSNAGPSGRRSSNAGTQSGSFFGFGHGGSMPISRLCDSQSAAFMEIVQDFGFHPESECEMSHYGSRAGSKDSSDVVARSSRGSKSSTQMTLTQVVPCQRTHSENLRNQQFGEAGSDQPVNPAGVGPDLAPDVNRVQSLTIPDLPSKLLS